MTEERKTRKRFIPIIIGAVVLVTVAVCFVTVSIIEGKRGVLSSDQTASVNKLAETLENLTETHSGSITASDCKVLEKASTMLDKNAEFFDGDYCTGYIEAYVEKADDKLDLQLSENGQCAIYHFEKNGNSWEIKEYNYTENKCEKETRIVVIKD